MNPIGGLPPTQMQLPLTEKFFANAKATDSKPDSFAEMISEGIGQVNNMQSDAQSQVHELLTGGDVSQVEVMTAVQKADMAFRMLVQVRNKLMAAYEEINAIRI